MSSISLLDRTRKLGQLLHNNTSATVVFNDICMLLGDILESDVLVLSRRGKVLGVGECCEVCRLQELLRYEVGAVVDQALNDRFLAILSTQDNVNLMTLGFATDAAGGGGRYHAVASPIYAGGERLGTLFLFKDHGWYEMDDIILIEYAATVVGLELLRSLTREADESDRREQGVKSALDALTATEKEAMKHILNEMDNSEALIVTSRIADETGIGRSMVVNAIRKMESAGIIESHSAGVKGTRIRVLNELIYEELCVL